ncbi:hypothetical protein B296_00021481 [Ensete ventricosum]|uniref:ATP-dependent RNA helicase Ski2/MTR4 C-terminal domain-containing protein n=1 Tax=Ensete ventricosum TaxID=4639 RepID=A0A426ZEP6_ENSVE|nr:hypothetical protein B296_00021481 [Ensete ventricosum]
MTDKKIDFKVPPGVQVFYVVICSLNFISVSWFKILNRFLLVPVWLWPASMLVSTEKGGGGGKEEENSRQRRGAESGKGGGGRGEQRRRNTRLRNTEGQAASAPSKAVACKLDRIGLGEKPWSMCQLNVGPYRRFAVSWHTARYERYLSLGMSEESDLKQIMVGKPTRLESQFRLTYTMILHLLRVEELKNNTSEPSLTPKLAHAKMRLYDTAIRLGQLQSQFKLAIDPVEYARENLKFGLVEVVYEWAKGTPFADICELTDVPEGLIVRTIVRLDETCREFKNAASIMGNTALYKKMETASNAIKRDIVFAASLYVTGV